MDGPIDPCLKMKQWNGVMTKIGKGQFGNVYLAEVSAINKGTKSLAAIKALKADYSLHLKGEFEIFVST